MSIDGKPGFSRLNEEERKRLERSGPPPRATRRQRGLEILLFTVAAVIIALTGLASYSIYAPAHKRVPNHVGEGLAADRLNIVLIGIGGDSHPGGGRELADSLILASIKPSTRQVALISIPRDYFVRIGKYGQHRINRAHEIGEGTTYPGGGPALTMSVIEDVFDQPVHAFVRVDFAAFKEAIDAIGGVELCVESTFHDKLFNDTFYAGYQMMNGDRALRYARYRYSSGPERGNYSREMRQQQLLDAIRRKLQQDDSDRIVNLLQTARAVSRHTETNLSKAQIASLYSTMRNVTGSQLRRVSLRPYMEQVSVRTLTTSGAVQMPKGGSSAEIQQLAADVFDGPEWSRSSVRRSACGPSDSPSGAAPKTVFNPSTKFDQAAAATIEPPAQTR